MTPSADEAGAVYSRRTLARLVLSDQAVRVADYATGLVSTRNDADTGNGGRASQASQLVSMARQALVAAVIYERERGCSWEEIGRYLEIEPAEAQARFGSDLSKWLDAFEDEHRGVPHQAARQHLPQAALHPDYVGELLDRWAFSRITLTKDEHEVTGALLGLPVPGEF